MSVLIHRNLIDELFIPQPVAHHAVIKQLLQDIASTSILTLDDYSMSKLWDLMTMIFKWQISVATNQNIFDITRRHLTGVATLMPHYFQEYYIEQAILKFESLSHKFTDNDYKCLSNTMILWFAEYHTKISVLIRLGLQKKDGTFSLPETLDPEILQNLGENIYKYDNKKNPVEEYEQRNTDTSEINCILSTIEKLSLNSSIELQLPIQIGNCGESSNKKTIKLSRDTRFENIDTNIKTRGSDLTFNPNIPKTANEDLLDMMRDN